LDRDDRNILNDIWALKLIDSFYKLHSQFKDSDSYIQKDLVASLTCGVEKQLSSLKIFAHLKEYIFSGRLPTIVHEEVILVSTYQIS
jgi:hypothetical protein